MKILNKIKKSKWFKLARIIIIKLLNKIRKSKWTGKVWIFIDLLLIIFLCRENSGRISILVVKLVLFLAFNFLMLNIVNSNKKEEFNKDSLKINSVYLILLLVLIGEISNYTIFYGFIAVLYIFLFSMFEWIAYFFRCIKVINELKKDRYLFIMKMIKSMLSSSLVFWSGTIIIFSLFSQDCWKTIFQVFNMLINSCFPLIDMYTYVRSEIDTFDKQKEKYKYDFYNYN